MALIAKSGGDFTPAPEGSWPGVCVDIVDLGMVESKMYGPSHQCEIRVVLDAEPPLPNGKPHMSVRRFTVSLGKKSNLRPFLEAWRGRKFTEEELKGFDIENLLGANGLFQIMHVTSNGNTYGNITAVMPFPKGMPKMAVPADYVRQAERDKREQYEQNPDGQVEEFVAADSDVPF